MSDVKIGFLGAGNMASAMIAGILGAGMAGPDAVRASDPRQESREVLEVKHGIRTSAVNAEIAQWADVLVLAVKPQVVSAVLVECGKSLGSRHLLLSIAAGVSTATLAGGVGD